MKGIRLIAAISGALLVFCTGIALAVQGGPSELAASASPQEEPGVEIKADRTETSQTFRLPDGALQTRIFETPINYRDAEGNWKPIGDQLEEVQGGGLTNGPNAFDVHLPERLGAEPVRLSTGGQWVSAELLGPDTEVAQLEGGTARYESGKDGTSFEFSGLANGLKEDIEIANASAPSSFNFNLGASNGLTPELADDGSIEFRDTEGKVAVVLPAPTISDSSVEGPGASNAVHYKLDPAAEGHWRLTVEADREWIEAPDRQFPARLDPTLTVPSPILDCNIGGKAGATGWGFCGSGGRKELALAYHPQLESSKDEWSRALLRYGTSTIPTNAYIASATLKMHSSEAALNTSGVELRQTTKPWTKEATWSRYDYESKSGPKLWQTEGGDYGEEVVGKITTSERGSQSGWWNLPVSAKLIEVLEPKLPHSGTEGPLSLIAKLIDDKSRECGGSSCTQRLVNFESSAAANPENRPYLSIVYYQQAPSASRLTSPEEGSVTSRRLMLQSALSAGTTGVTYQFREGKSGRFETIPTSLVRNAEGQEVKWPLVVSGESKAPTVYFDAAHATAALRSHGGPIEVRALFDGLGVSGYSVPVNATVNRFIGGPADATASVGPGTVDLLTGNFTVSRTDVSIPGFGSALEFTRTSGSRDSGAAGASPVFGQGWKPGSPVEEAGGAEWRSVREVVPSTEEQAEGLVPYALLTDLEGYEYAFEKVGETWTTPPELTGWVLAKEANGFALTDSAGNRTLFQGEGEYLPTSITQTGGSANSTQMVYAVVGGKRRLRMIIAPTASGITCNESTAQSTVGCRSLSFAYSGGHLGEPPEGRLLSITYYGPTGPNSMSHWEVANYAYNAEGRLSAEWDPRISPALKETYTYESGGQLHTITPPGEEPWTMEYGNYDEEEANGRLMDVKRPSLTTPSTAQTTIVYGVPISGSGAPYEMGASTVGKWGEKDVPQDATAIFPPDEVPSNPPSSYAHATVYYLDAEGQQVNVAAPSGAGTSEPAIATTETDEHGNVVRELSAENRLRALAAENTVARSEELEVKRHYNADGTQMEEEWGPMHQVRLESGETVQGRLHRVVQYEDAKNGWSGTGPNPHLPTKEITGASVPGRGIDPDQRETEFKYDWTLRKPTETIVDPGTSPHLNLRTRTAYDSTTGLPTEQSLPAKPGGGDAHTTKTIYYTAAENPLDVACSHYSGWANLPCKVTPAAQPGTQGQPELLVTRYASYNALAEPTETIESPGGKEATNRKTITTYDTAGRQITNRVEGGGTAISPTQTLYSSTTGRPVEQKFTCEANCEGFDNQATTTTYDTLGRVTAYQDADGNTATATYDLLGRPVTTSDGKGTQTRTYDSTSGLLTKLEDSGAGTFTASYDAEGNIAEEGLPDGLVATTTYNEAGEPVHLAYNKTTFCSIECTWLEFGAERSIYGQVLAQSGTLSSQQYSYDKAGRLTLTKDTPQGSGCTTRSYSYEADSNRTALVTRQPGIGGVCDLASEGTTKSYSYDTGDRLIGSGISYDSFGRTTSLSGSYAGGETLSTSYYSNDMIASQAQGGITNSYQLDATLRQRLRTQTGGSEPGTEVFHYAGGSDSPAWTERASGWTRNIEGIGGELAAIQDSAKGTTLQLTNLHGDVVATASVNPEATKLLATFESDEFGNPKQGSTPRFGWLGGKQRRTELPSGVIQMGVRSYIPALGRFISTDPVSGGSANAYDYSNADPVNHFDLTGEKPWSEASEGPCHGYLHVWSPKIRHDKGGHREAAGRFYARLKMNCGAAGYVITAIKITKSYIPLSGPSEPQSKEVFPKRPMPGHWGGTRKFDCLPGSEYEYRYEIALKWASVAGAAGQGGAALAPPGEGMLRLSAQQHCGHGHY